MTRLNIGEEEKVKYFPIVFVCLALFLTGCDDDGEDFEPLGTRPYAPSIEIEDDTMSEAESDDETGMDTDGHAEQTDVDEDSDVESDPPVETEVETEEQTATDEDIDTGSNIEQPSESEDADTGDPEIPTETDTAAECYKGDVVIEYIEAENLKGPEYDYLREFSCIDGDLVIQNNRTLKDFQGLHTILNVYGDVSIISNNIAKTLLGFGNLEYIRGDLTIATQIERLDGMHLLFEVGGDLAVTGCENLGDFSGFRDLKIVGGGIEIGFVENITLCDACEFFIQLDSFGDGIYLHDYSGDPVAGQCEYDCSDIV